MWLSDKGSSWSSYIRNRCKGTKEELRVHFLAAALSLPASANDPARAVLADHGNMSSPTVLFLVEHLQKLQAPRPCVALAFGPGLTAEAALFRYETPQLFIFREAGQLLACRRLAKATHALRGPRQRL